MRHPGRSAPLTALDPGGATFFNSDATDPPGQSNPRAAPHGSVMLLFKKVAALESRARTLAAAPCHRHWLVQAAGSGQETPIENALPINQPGCSDALAPRSADGHCLAVV